MNNPITTLAPFKLLIGESSWQYMIERAGSFYHEKSVAEWKRYRIGVAVEDDAGRHGNITSRCGIPNLVQYQTDNGEILYSTVNYLKIVE